MIEAIVAFFSTEPPAMDPTLVPWIAALVAGNIITVTGLWAFLKYVAKLTPWAADDKILQIITGGVSAVKGAVMPLMKKGNGKKEMVVEEKCVDGVHLLGDNGKCKKCGQPIK